MNKQSNRKPPPPGPGRPKGSKNRATVVLKEAILMAAAGAHRDGLVGYLQAQAIESPSAFLALIGKVLPLTIAGDKDNPLKTVNEVRVTFVDP
jgi:hypothetical protein